MDDTKIAKLEKELKEMDENLMLTATFGKELLEENGALNSKLEELHTQNQKLQQENYALNLKCQTKDLNFESISGDIEQIEAANKNLVAHLNKTHLEELNEIKDKLSSQLKLVALLEDEKITQTKMIDELQSEVETVKERGHETIFSELSVSMAEDSLQYQIISLTNEKTELIDELKLVQRKYVQCQKKVSSMEEMTRQTLQQLEYKECEHSSLQNIIEKKKTEIEELRVEIETMNIQQIDPKKRGNSLFAELEDNRQMVEGKYLQLKENFTFLQHQYQFKHDQNSRLKTHLASLLAKSANRGSLEYQEELQGNVASLTTQLLKMVETCKKSEENNKQSQCPCLQKKMKPDSMLDGYRHLYKQAQNGIKIKTDEISELVFNKAYLTDQIFELQKKNNMANNSKNSLSAEVIRLRVKLVECGVDLDAEVADTPTVSNRVEKLPFFDKIQHKKAELEEKQALKNKEVVKIENVQVHQEDKKSIKDNVGPADNCLNNVKSLRESDGKSEEKENLMRLLKSQEKPSKHVTFGEPMTDNVKLDEDKAPLKEKNAEGRPKRNKMIAPHITVGEAKQSDCKQQ